MQCIVDGMVLKLFETSTIKRHIQRHHKESLDYSEHRKHFLAIKFENEWKAQQSL